MVGGATTRGRERRLLALPPLVVGDFLEERLGTLMEIKGRVDLGSDGGDDIVRVAAEAEAESSTAMNVSSSSFRRYSFFEHYSLHQREREREVGLLFHMKFKSFACKFEMVGRVMEMCPSGHVDRCKYCFTNCQNQMRLPSFY